MQNKNNIQNNKNYYSFSDYVKNKFGVKVGKISIDTDFGCAHKANEGGCRFCNLNSYKPPYVAEEDINNQSLLLNQFFNKIIIVYYLHLNFLN